MRRRTTRCCVAGRKALYSALSNERVPTSRTSSMPPPLRPAAGVCVCASISSGLLPAGPPRGDFREVPIPAAVDLHGAGEAQPVIKDPAPKGLFGDVAADLADLEGVDARHGRGGNGNVVHLSRSEEHTSELQSLMRNSYAV